MMKRPVLIAFFGAFLFAVQVPAQQKLVTGKVSREAGVPLSGVSVIVKGTTQGTQTNNSGDYSLRVETGRTLQFRLIGYQPQERVVGTEASLNVQLEKTVSNLDAVVVTALGQTTVQRSLGTSQQTVIGGDVAQTGRENFINGLQGRVAGVEVTSTSGVPGASSSITIRGVSSISSSNQPLMIIDGLPMDNRTLNTGVLVSDGSSLTAFSNRGVDFTNRAADVNPEDIETMVVLKGPEASALYGIDAANGAIVITTKRGKIGGGLEYSDKFRFDQTRGTIGLQKVYGPTSLTGGDLGSFSYFGLPYASGTPFFDNQKGFFQTGFSQNHNLTFSGAAADNKLNYRLAVAVDRQAGVIRKSDYDRVNLTGSTGGQATSWLRTDLSFQYAQSVNNQASKGDNGPLLGLLLWPQTNDATNFLTPAGTRLRTTLLSASGEIDNPYFNIEKNRINQKNGRLIANVGLIITPFSWGSLRTNVGSDTYTNENLILRNPESAAGFTFNGLLDVADQIQRNYSAQTVFNVNHQVLFGNLGLTALVGNAISDAKLTTNASFGQDFLDPNFVSINNTNVRQARTTIEQRRLIGVFGSATLDYNDYAFVTVTGRNDWTSTIPIVRNSFFYPSVSGSLVVSDAFPALKKFMSAKLRGGYAQVGKDARPYAYRPSLEYKTTANGGYGYGFTGPNLALKPEFAVSREFGAELGFFDSRVTLDFTNYRKQTKDQIVNDIRGSYATGFILFNLNGAETRNTGTEITLGLTPILTNKFSWNITSNFDHSRGVVLALPHALPETYVSDTWLFGNVRNGTAPGQSTRSLTGLFYLRNNAGKILIDPSNGLPLRSTLFIPGPGKGYDRQPDFTLGVTNSFRYKDLSLSFLLDFRRGGDVFNATEQYLTTRGLSTRTLDREKPRVLDGVLRDGKENTATPTTNSIVVIPAVQPLYYTSISEELFIEKNINWVRMRDLTLRMNLPGRLLRARGVSVAVTGTDLFLFTNYTGLDPVVNGNTAAVGGSGASGIDYGNFPMPRGVSFSLKVNY
ncbi:MAG: SusC/RagA family TonB-linked outer membrane protein [Gemmatimonadota bacterium]|nr:SusC/RagA family TonB-linked outer membrane protein [Gemmatimonadota bacterium]